MQLQVKTLLNALPPFPGFVYRDIRLPCHRDGQPRCIEITVRAHEGRTARCSRCLQPAPGQDPLPQRSWLFVPWWGLVTWFLQAARRVHGPEHGVVMAHVPGSDGQRPVTLAMMCFLSRRARRLSWRETARAFGTRWECVYRSVQWLVEWGLAHRIKETFPDFWRYRSLTWASAFLAVWSARALRSRLEPMKKVARMRRSHEDLLMNWCKAQGEISSGAVEGLNHQIRVVTRRSYGFRTCDAMEIALYHT